MKNTLCLCLLIFFMSSCSYAVYDMNKGELKIAKKTSYLVKYSTDVPAGTTAEISYTGEDNTTQKVKGVTGKWEKSIELSGGQAVKFTVDVLLPQTNPVSQLVTSQSVDGVVVNEKVQMGKKVMYRFGFKLP